MTEDPGLQFLIYTAEPASSTAERLALLGSWAASQTWAGNVPQVVNRQTTRSTSADSASE